MDHLPRFGLLPTTIQSQIERYAQRLFVDEMEVKNSVEGEADRAWPASPPLQQLSLQCIPNASVILGVNIAGAGHWNTGLQATPNLPGAF